MYKVVTAVSHTGQRSFCRHRSLLSTLVQSPGYPRYQSRRSFQILYEDQDIIAVNKPAEMLSVPGRGEVALGSGLPRSEEWIGSIVATANIPRVYKKLSSDAVPILNGLLGKLNVPRNERSFKNYLRVGCHVRNTSVQDELWRAISGVDDELHKVPLATIRDRDMSVATALSAQLGLKLYVVHRLDLETTGVLVFAKYPEAAEGLSRQFRRRETEKLYLAEVSGHITEESVRVRMAALSDDAASCMAIALLPAPADECPLIRICAPLAPNRADLPRQKVDFTGHSGDATEVGEVAGAAKSSETVVMILSYHSRGAQERSTLVLLKPITGRSHQLRVHLQYLGHPILHDRLYCPEAVRRAGTEAPESNGLDPTGLLKLHAFRLYFRHPISNSPMSVTAATDANSSDCSVPVGGTCDNISHDSANPMPFVCIDGAQINIDRLSSGIDLLIQS